MIDEGHAVVQAPLPVVITVTKEINVPRLPSLRSIIKSKSAVIPVWGVAELSIEPAKVGLAGSYTRVTKLGYPDRSRKTMVFQGELKVQIDLLCEKLKDSGLV